MREAAAVEASLPSAVKQQANAGESNLSIASLHKVRGCVVGGSSEL